MADSQRPVVANSHAAAAVAIAVAALAVAVVAAVAVVVAVAVPTSMLRPWQTANNLLWQIAPQLQRWR